MRARSINSEISRLANQIITEVKHWKDIHENGCSDSFWADGCNMNLTRNHIIYCKKQLEELCEENGIELPEEYYIPTPPIVDNWYMADLKCQRIFSFHTIARAMAEQWENKFKEKKLK